MQKRMRIVFCVAAVILLIAAAGVISYANATIVDSGSCGADGSNVTWELHSDGELVISGSGEMKDYLREYNSAPWYSNASRITSVTIKKGVVYIGNDAFSGCSRLTGITIPDSVTSIGSRAFYECSSLTSISVPDSVTSIGDYAFSHCSSLTSIRISDNVTSIGILAFYYCSSLTSVTIPDGVTSIGGSAFDGCSSLISITIPDSVTSIGGRAFSGCSSLTSVTIPDSVTSIGSWAFYNCSSLRDIYITDINAWINIDFRDSYSNPMYYADNFYLNGTKVSSVSIPQGTQCIKSCAFYGLSDIVSITIPDSVTSIGSVAFYDCSSLISITIPDGVTSIGGSAFNGCRSLTSITISESVTSIDSGAFSRCFSLKSVYITDINVWTNMDFGDSKSNPMYYADDLYLNETKITSVSIMQGVQYIKPYVFYGLSNVVSITIPDSVTSIGEYAFYDCSGLASITIPDSVTSIGEFAFYDCSSLTSITIPDSVTSIGEFAFSGCSNLRSVYITDINAWINISFGNSGSNPFSNDYAHNLYLNGALVELLEIPEGVQVISKNIFSNLTCIKKIFIPKSLIGIAANAFSGCNNISKVFYGGSESDWSKIAISSGNEYLVNAERYYNATFDDYYCRIATKVSDGGRITVDKNMAEEGTVITITATPFAGYELTELYLDGKKLTENTFTVTGNHEVSAKFTLIPVYGGTSDYRLSGITVTNMAGEKQQELIADNLLVTISVEHLQGTEGAMIMLAEYNSNGQCQGLLWLTLNKMPNEMELSVSLPVNNKDGKIVNLKAFVVNSMSSLAPVGNAVSFGDV